MPGYAYELPARQLVSQQDAAITEPPRVPRARFTGVWTRKMTFDAGYLVPFLVEEVLPGDHLKYDVTAYLRLSTPLFPLMDNQRIDTFFFFVPNRLVWVNWVKMMGEQTNPGDSIAYTVPVLTCPNGGYTQNTIFDHMGLPCAGQITAGQQIAPNALPFRAYNLIYNNWFRDENLIGSTTVATDNGADTYSTYTELRRAKSHDYFTSALPWAQKFTAPSIPMTGSAPISGLGQSHRLVGKADGATYYDTANPTGVAYPNYVRWNDSTVPVEEPTGTSMGYRQKILGGNYVFDIYADLTASTAGISINQLRQTWMIQQLLERDARGGTRYTEQIRAQFGVINPDFRLQRPEYIGGGQTPLQLTPIAQTAPTTGVPLGALGAAGVATGQHKASYAATEHGFIIGLINVRTEISYQQGLHRMWTRQTRYDYYTPALAELGEQAILQQEIYCTGVDADDAIVFGYQERWQEYRTRYNEITGQFRSTNTGTIDTWHFAQKFTSAPSLVQSFIEDIPPMTRVLAAGSAAGNMQYLADIMIHRDAVRPIPAYGTPATIGRF